MARIGNGLKLQNVGNSLEVDRLGLAKILKKALLFHSLHDNNAYSSVTETHYSINAKIRAATDKLDSHVLVFNAYLRWGTSQAFRVSTTCSSSSPRKFVIIKDHKRMSTVCNQNRLEGVCLKG